MYQEVIKAVMKERGVDPREIPLESNFIVKNIASLSLSRRYYRAKGFAHFSCPTESCSKRGWSSAHAWCVLDLRDQCVVHKFGQGCIACTSNTMPRFMGEEIKTMAEFAVDRYLMKVGRLQRPIKELAIVPDHKGPPHDESACEMCKILGRSCLSNNYEPGQENIFKMQKYRFEAAKYGNTEQLKELIDASNVNEKDEDGNTVLHIAAQNGFLDCVSTLINTPGIEVNCQDKNGSTPLHLAARRGIGTCVQILLSHGSINIAVQDNAGNLALHEAAMNCRLTCLRVFKSNGLRFDQKSKDGSTVLHYAAKIGWEQGVENILQDRDAANVVDYKNEDGHTALHHAAKYGHVGCVRALTEYGSDVNAQSKTGSTPLQRAVVNGHSEVVKVLLDKGTEVDKFNTEGCTALHNAAKYGHVGCVNLLIENGSDVNAQSKIGNTPMHYAVASGHSEVVKVLFENEKTDLDKCNNDGKTAQDLAVMMGLKDIIEAMQIHQRKEGGETQQNTATLKLAEIDQLEEHKDWEVTFAPTHGENIRLEDEGKSACRFTNNSKAIVVTSAPLPSDMIFQVEIVETNAKWGNNTLSIGVTAQNATQVVSVDNAKELVGESFFVTSSVSNGSAALHVGGQEVGQLPGNISFHNLKAGDTVGLLYEDSGTLHFFLNGVHMVQLPCTVPKGVYGFVDIYGQCVKVILRPLIYWSGGSPRHVMNDDSALDMERDLKAKELFEIAMKQGSVKMTIIKCLVLGIAGVGKTNLKRLLLPDNKDKSTGRVSTGLADNPVQAFVGSVNSIVAGVDEKDPCKWEIIDDTKIMQVLASAFQVETLPPIINANNHSLNEMPSKPANETSLVFSSDAPTPPLETGIHSDHGNPAAEKVTSLFTEAFKNATGTKNVHVKLVQFIDSGGQPQFLELLPIFVQDVSIILFAINLSENLEHCPMIYYYGQDNHPVGRPYRSLSSHKQVMEQCVRAAHASDLHPHVLVVGTHRDEKHKCSEKKEDKDRMIKQVISSKRLIRKSEADVIWDINGKDPDSYDQNVADTLRQAIVDHCHENSATLPLKWFALEMSIKHTAVGGVISFRKCFQLARSLGMDEEALQTALLHMVKYNLLLWYHNVPALRDAVFCDPHVILTVITDLVKCKYELAGGDVSRLIGIAGVNEDWCSNFKTHAIISSEFLSCIFKRHFNGGVFTVEYFTALMCHLFIMVPLEGGDYLMPILLDPLSPEKVIRNNTLVEPLLLYFQNDVVPYGMFSCLVAFLRKECSVRETSSNVPVQLHRNYVSLKCKKFVAEFSVIDSVAFIKIHLESARDVRIACPKIRKLILEGIKKCADVLHYNGVDHINDGFVCSNKPCTDVALPYEDDPAVASCIHCHTNMDLTSKHTVWITMDTEDKAMTAGFSTFCSPFSSNTTFSFKNILNALKEVVDWKQLGAQLDISRSKMKEIDVNNRGQVASCRHDLVEFWLDSDQSCSWIKLIDALKSIDHIALAEKITNTYCQYQSLNKGTSARLLNTGHEEAQEIVRKTSKGKREVIPTNCQRTVTQWKLGWYSVFACLLAYLVFFYLM